MSAFFHTSSGASVRSRRGKDRETKPRTNSISSTGRRHKDSSKSHDNKSPPSKSPVLQPTTLYAQQNLALEQLPSLPSSAATSPTLSSSGVRSSIVGPNKAGIYQLTQQPYTPAALQQYLERDTEEAEEAQENELTKSLHLPPRPQDSCKTDEAQTGECSTPSNIEDAVAEAVYRDEATPLANTHGSERSRKVFGPPPSAEQFQSPSASSKKSHWRRSGPAPAMEKHGSLDRLSKQATSVSDPGADVEGFYKPCEELENRIDTLQFNMHRSLPMRSTVSAESRAGRQTASEDSQTGPYTGQRSTPSTLRTFTPPAPPFPVASSPVLPAFASPVPLRARPSAEPHMGYQQSSGYSLRHPSSVNQGYFYGHHTLQHHLEAGPLQFGPLAEGPPRSDLPVSTVPSNITGHETGEVNRTELFDNTMGLLHKLYNALPRMRMLVANLQYTGASNTIANCKYKVDDDYSKLLKQKEERIEELLGNFDEHKRRHLTESDKLKSDLMSMEKKSVNLQMELLSRQRSRDSIEREIKASKQEVAYTKIKLQEDSLAKANDVESRMSTVKLNLQEKSEEVSVLRQKISEMEATWAQERENAEANCVRRVMQLETAHQGERAELEKLLGVEQHELLVLRKNDTDARKAWDDERRELVHKLDVERQHATDERERERRSIEQHWQAINEIQRKEHSAVIEEIKVSHELSLREQQKTYGILETENKRLQQENKRLEDAWNSDKARFAKTASDFRSAATRMNEQNVSSVIVSGTWTDHF